MVYKPGLEKPEAQGDEQRQEWLKYHLAGGMLGFQEWIDAGQPTITEERASISWMERLDAYLSDQLKAGNIDQSEADVLWDDIQDRLFGTGKYAKKRQTVLELPAAILSDVERYWVNLPITAQREAEQAAKAEAQRLQDIASQRMQLPLYAGGTQQQQVIAGYNAIQKLQTQKTAAPPYLQEVIDSQIAQLQESISQIQESIRREAGSTGRGVLRRVIERPPSQEEIEARESEQPGEAAKAFAEKYGMSPESARLAGYAYLGTQRGEQFPNPQDYSNLTEQEKLDLLAVGQEARYGMEEPGTVKKPKPKPYNAPSEMAEVGPQIWKDWFSQYYPSIARQFQQKPEEERTEKGWMALLSKERARLREEFASQSPYSRGERPGAFQPRIKTVAF